MNYNRYAALHKRNRNSYHNAVGGGKYGSAESKGSSESKEETTKRIIAEVMAKSVAFNESMKLREGK